MDKPVDNPPIRYDIATLRRLEESLRGIARDFLDNEPARTPDRVNDLEHAADFLRDTAAVLEKQRENLRNRRRLEARARRSRKRQNRKK